MSEGDPKTSSIVDAQKAHANLKKAIRGYTQQKKDCLLELLDFDLGSSVPMYALISSADERDGKKGLVHCCFVSLPHSPPSLLIRLLKLFP